MKIIKKFYKPFAITYILLSIALGSYPSFNFFSLKGQIIILSVSLFNGIMGIYIKKL
tara:strand:+ start:526 stop:696 length:171 start_codon:yes stop_codon:yes gene_type:complete